MNIFIGALFLRTPVRLNVVIGAPGRVGGISLVFLPETNLFQPARSQLCRLATKLRRHTLRLIRNILAARNQKENLPVVQTNAFGMGYGALLMFAIAILAGASFRIEATQPISSL